MGQAGKSKQQFFLLSVSKTRFVRHNTCMKNTTTIDYDNGNKLCVSYQTPVAVYANTDGWFGVIVLGYDWDCSVTTISHVSQFLMNFCGRKLRAAEIRSRIASGEIMLTTSEELRNIACGRSSL